MGGAQSSAASRVSFGPNLKTWNHFNQSRSCILETVGRQNPLPRGISRLISRRRLDTLDDSIEPDTAVLFLKPTPYSVRNHV